MFAYCVPLWWLAAVAQQIHLCHDDFSVLYEEMSGRAIVVGTHTVNDRADVAV